MAWRGRIVATTAALPQELTAAFLHVGAEAVVCAREPGQDAAGQAAFFRSIYSGVLGGGLSIADALSAAGEASPAAFCQPLALPQCGLIRQCQWSCRAVTSAHPCCHATSDWLLPSVQITCCLSVSALQMILACAAGDAVPALRGSFACYYLLDGQVSETKSRVATQPETLLEKTAIGLQQTADLFVRRMSDSLALIDPFLPQEDG